ncbi:MAG: sigma-70 family RNA polymerase sigma factor [Planctomycetota bacterium]
MSELMVTSVTIDVLTLPSWCGQISLHAESFGERPAVNRMNLSPDSTTSLLVSSRQGDQVALGDLLLRYRGYLLMLAHRYLSDQLRRRIDAADIVQVTFLEAQRDLKAFRGSTPAEFAGWLRGMLKNNVASAISHHVMTQKRSTRKEVHAAGDSGGDGVKANAHWIEQMPGGKTSPSGVAVRAEAVEAMMNALHELPETQAEAIRLRYMEGLPLAEIVERMGKSDTAVAGLLKRGLKKLRTLLDTGSSPWWSSS